MAYLKEMAEAMNDEYFIEVKHDITQKKKTIVVPGSWTEAQINEALPPHWYVA